MSLLLEVRADNVDGSGGLGGNSPTTTSWHDLSGNGNHGTLNNWPSPASYAEGWSNVNSATSPCRLVGSGSTGGSGENVSFGNINGGVFPDTGTLELWFTSSVFDGDTNHRNLLTTGSLSNSNNGIRIEQTTETGHNDLVVIIGDSGSLSADHLGLASAALNADLQLVVTWDKPNNRFSGYLNGQIVFSNTANTHWPDNFSLHLLIGYNANRCWQGSVRICRIYDAILTDAQVMTNWVADAHPIKTATVGTTATYTPPVVSGDTWSTTDPAWSNSGGTFSYTGIYEDGGTIREVSFVSGNGYGTLNLVLVTWRNLTNSSWTRYGSNPIVPANCSAPWTKAEQKISGTYYSLYQNDGDLLDEILLYKSTDLQTWTADAGSPALTTSAGTWKDHFLVHPNVVKDGSTYRCFYTGKDSGGTESIGLATSSDHISWSDYASNPVITGGYTIPGAWMVGSEIYLLATTRGQLLYLFTSSDGGHTFTNQGVVLTITSGEWDYDSGDGLFQDPFIVTNPVAGNYELWYTGKSGIHQEVGCALSLDGFVWFKFAASVLAKTTNAYEDKQVGDPGPIFVENYIYLLYSGIATTSAASGGSLATVQSDTTGVYLGITQTCYASGNTTYASSPNGLSDTGITATPASGSATVLPTTYTPGGTGTLASLTVGGVNGTSVSFSLPGFTAGADYSVRVDGSALGTYTADGSGVLSFSYSAWTNGSTNVITVSSSGASVPVFVHHYRQQGIA